MPVLWNKWQSQTTLGTCLQVNHSSPASPSPWCLDQSGPPLTLPLSSYCSCVAPCVSYCVVLLNVVVCFLHNDNSFLVSQSINPAPQTNRMTLLLPTTWGRQTVPAIQWCLTSSTIWCWTTHSAEKEFCTLGTRMVRRKINQNEAKQRVCCFVFGNTDTWWWQTEMHQDFFFLILVLVLVLFFSLAINKVQILCLLV